MQVINHRQLFLLKRLIAPGSPQVVGRKFHVLSFGYLCRGDGDFHRRAAVAPGSVGKQESLSERCSHLRGS
jgi:hypothetical protein